jgi:RNA polymerase sigma-70 factor (ECF subfamily)
VVSENPDIYAPSTEVREQVAVSPAQEAQFQRLFTSHHKAIQNYCLRRLPFSEANDAAAEVFLVAWRRIDEVPPGDEELPWLYGIGRNVVRNMARSARRHLRLVAKAGSLEERAVPAAETVVVRNAEHQRALDALARLRPEEQELVRLRTWEELPNRQIAGILGITERAVESRLTRIRRKLESMLTASGDSSSAVPHLSQEEVNGEPA